MAEKGDDERNTETEIDRDSVTNVTSDMETIRSWIEESGAKPAYRTTDEGEREPYLHHPDVTTEDYEEADWDEFHQRLDEDELALVRHGERAEESDQFEFVSRTEAIERAALDDQEVEEALLEGETVETEITETKVIEKTIREIETIESEVIESEIVRDEVIDTELVRREIVDVHIGDEETGIAIVEDRESADWEEDVEEFDVTAQEVITVDVDETREATREIIERKTVESRVVDYDVEGTETVESDTLEGRVELEGVQRNIVESDLLSGEVVTDDAIESQHIESEFTDEGSILTDIYERRVVKDEIVDHKRQTFKLVDTEFGESETVASTLVETGLTRPDVIDKETHQEIVGINERITDPDSLVHEVGGESSIEDSSISDDINASPVDPPEETLMNLDIVRNAHLSSILSATVAVILNLYFINFGAPEVVVNVSNMVLGEGSVTEIENFIWWSTVTLAIITALLTVLRFYQFDWKQEVELQ